MIRAVTKHLHNVFIPHSGNNWRAKSLHHDFLSASIITLLIFHAVLSFAFGRVRPTVLGVNTTISIHELVELTNKERQERGLTPLAINNELSEAAQEKASHMFAYNYWAHFAPDGTSPWFFFENNKYHYVYAGENLAKNFNDSNNVVAAWMASEKHRENILRAEYQDIGLAVAEGMLEGQPTTVVVQFFGTADKNYQQPYGAASQLTDNKQELSSSAIAANNEQLVAAAQSTQRPALLDIRSLQQNAAILVLGALIIVLLADMYIMERAHIFRISGKSMAHVVFIVVMLVALISIKGGIII